MPTKKLLLGAIYSNFLGSVPPPLPPSWSTKFFPFPPPLEQKSESPLLPIYYFYPPPATHHRAQVCGGGRGGRKEAEPTSKNREIYTSPFFSSALLRAHPCSSYLRGSIAALNLEQRSSYNCNPVFLVPIHSKGVTGNVSIDSNGDRAADYVLLMLQGGGEAASGDGQGQAQVIFFRRTEVKGETARGVPSLRTICWTKIERKEKGEMCLFFPQKRGLFANHLYLCSIRWCSYT